MFMLAYNILKDFGIIGCIIISSGINGWCFWKLFTNHLKHLDLKLTDVNDTVADIQKEIGPLKERVSKIEGMLE
jgi:peptidoglycan hydrolase CwlO-like protein